MRLELTADVLQRAWLDGGATTSSPSDRPRRRAQAETDRLGSASMMVTAAPRRASSQARMTAEVDLPAPPLGLAKTMVGIGTVLPAMVEERGKRWLMAGAARRGRAGKHWSTRQR